MSQPRCNTCISDLIINRFIPIVPRSVLSLPIADLIKDLEEDPDAPPDVRIVFLYQEEVLVNVPVVLVTLVP